MDNKNNEVEDIVAEAKKEMKKDAVEADKKEQKQDVSVIDRLCRFAFIMSTIGVLTIGICPAFGVMGIVVGEIFKAKKFELSPLNEDRCKKAKILGVVSLLLFVVDIVILAIYLPKLKGQA